MSDLRPAFLLPAQLNQYREVGSVFFPEVDWDLGLERVDRLLRKWEHGIFCLWKGKNIAGYIALWPLTRAAVTKLENGEITDDDIDAGCLPNVLAGKHENWIMTVIAVAETDKGQRREIINRLIDFLRQTQMQNWPCAIYAHAMTPGGQRFCRRTGFEFRFPAVADLCCLTRRV